MLVETLFFMLLILAIVVNVVSMFGIAAGFIGDSYEVVAGFGLLWIVSIPGVILNFVAWVICHWAGW